MISYIQMNKTRKILKIVFIFIHKELLKTKIMSNTFTQIATWNFLRVGQKFLFYKKMFLHEKGN